MICVSANNIHIYRNKSISYPNPCLDESTSMTEVPGEKRMEITPSWGKETLIF